MKSFSIDQIKKWDRFYRANFINSLTGFKSVSLIGTANKNRQANLAIFSSIVHIGSDPALVGYINRPRKAAPHTLANIEATGVYTINHIQPSFVSQAHQTSAKYPVETSEFDAVGLSPEFLNDVHAPFVKESKIKYALSLEDIVPIKINETFLVIGKIDFVHLEVDLLTADGFLQIDQAESICSNGIDSYYQVKPITRLPYAKVDLNE